MPTRRDLIASSVATIILGAAGCAGKSGNPDTNESQPKDDNEPSIAQIETVQPTGTPITQLEVSLSSNETADRVVLKTQNGEEIRQTRLTDNQLVGRLPLTSPSIDLEPNTYSIVLYRDGEVVDRREWTANQTTLPEGDSENSS